jgi:serine/threonine protein kinase
LVDVDSIQISENGKLLFSTNVGTPEYLPPEYYSQQNSGTLPKPVAFDLFALAVLFYEILIGVHPYGKPKGIDYAIPQLIQNDYFRHGKNKNLIVNRSECLLFDYLPINIQNLFIRAFEGQSNNRPQASEWQAELKKVIQDLEKGNNVFTKVKNKKPATPPKPTNPLPIPPIPIKKTSNKWYQKWQPLSLVAVIALCLIIGAFFAIQSLSSSDDYPKEETTENVIPSFDPQMIVGDYTAKEKIKEQVTMNGFIEAVSQNEYRITIYSDNAPVSDSFTYDGKPISSPTLEIKKNTIIFKKDNRLWELTK